MNKIFKGLLISLVTSVLIAATAYAVLINPAQIKPGSDTQVLTTVGTSTSWANAGVITSGNLTESTSSILLVTGGTNSVLGTGTTIEVKQASSTQSGFLSSTDWSTFNNKQPAGSYLTSSTGVTTFNGSSGAVTGVSSLSSANGLVSLNNSTGTITLTASTTPTFSNITDSGIAANSFIATDANHNLIATTTPSGSGGVTSLTASSSIGLSSATGTVNIGAKFYPIPFLIENPTNSENDDIFTFTATSTINSCTAVNKTVGDTLTFGLGYSTSRATATSSLNNLFSSAQTITSTTTPTIITINGSSTPGANNPLIFWTSGTASSTQFSLTCNYSIN